MKSTPFALSVLRHRFLRGRNCWTYRSAMEVWLDLGELEQHPSHALPGFTDRLLVLLPGLQAHHCGVGKEGGFSERLQGGTWMGHVLEHCVIELLNLAGLPTGFGQTRSTSQPGVYRMVFRARNQATGEAALQQGLAMLHAALNKQLFDVPQATAELHDVVESSWLGPSTAAIVAAATARGIPHLRLNDGNLVQLGDGAHQRRIWTAETELTSAIAENIVGDKDLTKTLLRACGVPVPEGQVVTSPQEAWEVAQDIGLPVVVKPSDGNHGRGVTLDLSNQADIEAAFGVADAEGSEVMVERNIAGHEHRLLVVGGRVVGGRARRNRRRGGQRARHRAGADRRADQQRPAPGHHRSFPAEPAGGKRRPGDPARSQAPGICAARRGARGPAPAGAAQRQRVHRLHRRSPPRSGLQRVARGAGGGAGCGWCRRGL
jgi:cyanophycin synthetase